MKIALVHDWFTRLGGAERVLIALHKIFPEASIYTLFYDKKFASEYLPHAKIIPSFLQKIPNIKKFHPWFKVLMPLAIESLNFSGFDSVISSSHEFSHGILLKQKSKHICYYHSPSRILWDRANEYVEDFKKSGRGSIKISLIKLGQHFLRLWDWPAGQRPDIVIANSNHVAKRIKKYYGREAKVIYPPVDINSKSQILNPKHIQNSKFKIQSYFLIVSQLYPHKNIDLAIKTFKLLNLNLVIIGEGPEKRRLKKLIGDSINIKLLGFIPDEKLPYFYENCLAYLICNEEDFGISPIEAMSFGKPVLAYKSGGAAETVLSGITGEFFDKLEQDELAEAVESISKKIKNDCYNNAGIRKYSEKFGFERFKKEILDILESLKYYGHESI
ncbi:MAG: glycosyltransferase [Patescibacteria group bacterium]